MNVIISSIDRILNYAKAESLRPLVFGTSCCAKELMLTAFSHNNNFEFTPQIFQDMAEHADLLICTGVITAKTAPELIKLYQKMPEPKYVIAVGVCAISGGMFLDSYSEIQGLDSILPVDIYLPGCPPEQDALIDAVKKLKNDIKNESILKRKEGIKAHAKKLQAVLNSVKEPDTEDFEVNK